MCQVSDPVSEGVVIDGQIVLLGCRTSDARNNYHSHVPMESGRTASPMTAYGYGVVSELDV